MKNLIGKKVYNNVSHKTGIITSVNDGLIEVSYHGEVKKHSYPSCFSSILELEDEGEQDDLYGIGIEVDFHEFIEKYKHAIHREIAHIRETGGKKYRILDGEMISRQKDEFLYVFDTDTEFHFPDSTPIKLWFPEIIVDAYVVSCEEFSIMFRTEFYLGDKVESVEFSAEQWMLLDALHQRLCEMSSHENSIAYKLACTGKRNIDKFKPIMLGQDYAIKKSLKDPISFIWGPPGTGKTHTLAKIAKQFISEGKRVLMVSYSNVSVDGALLRVAGMMANPEGKVLRYGYPRLREVVESDILTSYQYILKKYPAKSEEYQQLRALKKKLKKNDPERQVINKKLNKIREDIQVAERNLIQVAPFVATTISKAVIDKSLYTQEFDVVIFDEASMAYVPQIVFAGGLAKSHFICLGDFCQLPAIVTNKEDDTLHRDIFEYIGIVEAVNNGYGHDWLTMLNVQYRMHYQVAAFSGQYMYTNRLETPDKICESRARIAEFGPMKSKAMSLIDLSGTYSVCKKTMDGSRINILSALVSIKIAEQFVANYDIGIISPYSAQARLILAMIRDLREKDERFNNVTSATVHQFQGSERSIIIYDAVDCFRMPYPGNLLTSLKNEEANRLFNVALTRAKGKFIMIANKDYMIRKNLSNNLMFRKVLDEVTRKNAKIAGNDLIEMLQENGNNYGTIADTRENTWQTFLNDINSAKKNIHIDIPGQLDDNNEAWDSLYVSFEELKANDINIKIRAEEGNMIPDGLEKYVSRHPYVTNPVTVIDEHIIWFGQPLCAADFITEGKVLPTEVFPCIRFEGKYTARLLKAFLEFSH